MSFEMSAERIVLRQGVGGQVKFDTNIDLFHVTDRVAGTLNMPQVTFGQGSDVGGSLTTVLATGLTTQANFIMGSALSTNYGPFVKPSYFNAGGSTIQAAIYLNGEAGYVDLWRIISFDLDGAGNLLAIDEWNNVAFPGSFNNPAHDLKYDLIIGAFT